MKHFFVILAMLTLVSCARVQQPQPKVDTVAPAKYTEPQPEANTVAPATDTEPQGEILLHEVTAFDGTQDYLEIPSSSSLNVGENDFSISAWLRTKSGSGIEVIVDKRVEASGPIQGYSVVNYHGRLLCSLPMA